MRVLLVALALTALVAGCGSSTSRSEPSAPSPGSLEALWKQSKQSVALIPGTSDYSPGDLRISFLVVDNRGHLIAPPRARFWIAPSLTSKPFQKTVAQLERVGVAGLSQVEDAPALYVAHVHVTEPGTYTVLARPIGHASIGGIRDVLVKAHSASPLVGSRAYAHPEELLRDADTAMYRAKDLGRARHAVFDPAMHALARAQLQLDTDLRRAIEREELRLRYQPVVSLRSGQIVGCEALIVWEHPTRGTIPPGDFIPTAEETGLIVPIGRWALLQACIDAKAWNEARPRDSAIFVSVNLSARQLVRAELLEDVRGALLGSGLEARRLKLEVTESAIMEHAGSAALLLNQLKALTVGLLLDDFGTGYSSLSYLHNFRFDTLKIDRSFVARLEQSGKQAEIVRTIVSLARALQMDVVAEGVENASQLKQLQALEVHSAQGYWFSRALDAKAFLELLEARKAFPLPETPRLTDAG